MRRGLCLGVLGLIATLPAGCGGDDDTGGEGLAAAVPASVPVYVEGRLKPDEDEAAAIEAIAARFPNGDDLDATIEEAIDASLAGEAEESGELSYEDDVAPWIGDRGAFYFSSFAEGEEGGALLLEVTDEGAAEETIEKMAAADEAEEETKEAGGSEYLVDDDGDAVAVADDRFIIGLEGDVRASLEAAAGDSDSLADASRYEDGVDSVGGDDALAYAQLHMPGLIEAATDETEATPEQAVGLLEGIGFDVDAPVAMALSAQPDAAVLDLSLGFDPGGDTASPGLFAELPADSIIASGSALEGDTLAESFETGFDLGGRSAGADEAENEQLKQQLRANLGFDLFELLSGLGPQGFFLRGGTTAELQLGAVFEVVDEAAVSEAMSAARSAIGGPDVQPAGSDSVPGVQEAFSSRVPEFGGELEVIFTGDRLALSAGAAGGAAAGLASPETLGDSEQASSVSGPLGEAEPSVLVDVPKLLGLLEATTFAFDRDYPAAKPYLAPLDLLASGLLDEEDGLLTSRIVLTFREPGEVEEALEADEGEDEAEEVTPTTTPTENEPLAPTAGPAAEAAVRDTLREFNRTANLGKAKQACQRYFSQAFLSRLRTERECANSLASARQGKGEKTQIEIVIVRVDEHDGTASVLIRAGDVPGLVDIDLIYENGAWKIDAVTR